jgi:hypothetical protein
MISKTSAASLLIAASGVAVLVLFGIARFGQREDRAAPSIQPAQPLEARETEPIIEESAGLPPIQSFRQWAESAAASGFAQADLTRGMELAKARATSMKALIRQDPASALRQSLPADLRAALPAEISAAIEKPVKTRGMCSMQMICSHSSDTDHGNCESIPILLEDIVSWNAHYPNDQWRAHLGQTVGFDGIALDEELAVRSIAPIAEIVNP